MNSRLYTKKAVFAFAGVIVLLLVGCVLLNIFLIRPFIPKDDGNSWRHNKTDDGFVYYILTSLEDDVTFAQITYYNGNSKNVVIPSEILGYPVTKIGGFSHNKEIESVEIPDTVTSIGPEAFMNCNNLKKVFIPESVTEIGNQIAGGSNFVVYGFENSYAQQYCEENGIPFRAE